MKYELQVSVPYYEKIDDQKIKRMAKIVIEYLIISVIQQGDLEAGKIIHVPKGLVSRTDAKALFSIGLEFEDDEGDEWGFSVMHDRFVLIDDKLMPHYEYTIASYFPKMIKEKGFPDMFSIGKITRRGHFKKIITWKMEMSDGYINLTEVKPNEQ